VYPVEVQAALVDLHHATPGVSVRRLAEVGGVSHHTLERWINAYGDVQSPVPDGLPLRQAVLRRGSGLDHNTALTTAVALLNIARLRHGDAEASEEIRIRSATVRAALADADRALPLVRWVREHLKHVQEHPRVRPVRAALVTDDRRPNDEPALIDARDLVRPASSLSVTELLREADVGARRLLLDAELTDARAVVRSWVGLVDAASDLVAAHRDATPAPPRRGTGRIGDVLSRRAQALTQALCDEGWPSAEGTRDVRFDWIARSLVDAAAKLRAEGEITGERAYEALSVIPWSTHSVYLATHAAALALCRPAGDVGTRWHGRVEALEQVLYAERTPPTGLDAAPVRPAAPSGLTVAAERWLEVVSVVLAGHPNPVDLAVICHGQARVIGTTERIVAAFESAGLLPATVAAPSIQRRCQDAVCAWNALASRWQDLTFPGEVPELELHYAARALDAACLALTHRGAVVADREAIVSTQAAPEAVFTLLTLAAADHEIASPIQRAATSPGLTGPARVLARRAADDAEAGGLIDTTPITPSLLLRNLPIPLPVIVARGLERAAAECVTSADALAAAAQTHEPRPPRSMVHPGVALQRTVAHGEMMPYAGGVRPANHPAPALSVVPAR
jgi:hypothetical protein